ncbi:glycoside hydrolase [Aspergillus steynii IBT 23096]|uniref:chitinase n=1 Tax=Aspergillus steynii IBT 23096 TaxID=1392250 RepID=A0A2I2FR88_9EURO|nr:glycoside hydrolase [Aspergillus steynii IBT 23096]PLB43154.1 glycoside hydrolase [Aspergillus steynii IBT 23096]
MFFQRAFAVGTAVSCLVASASAFDAQSKSNIAVYYGQGYDQPRLREICQDASVDIINLGFINVFPGQGAGGWPGSNFANQCDGTTYEIGGVKTQLLSGCHQLAEDIPLCQAAGKKVLLSLGGATPDNQRILSENEALLFTDFLWGAFGPIDDAWVAMDGPRPFGDVVVDGFDFDIEHNGGFGYATMVDRFREHFELIPDRTFYISGAPQCSIPDQQLGLAIAASVFDFVWVQFYNTAACSARNFFNIAGSGNGGFNYDGWVNVIQNGGNRAAKLYIGLPASESAANPGYYLTPEEVDTLVAQYMGRYPETFGGIMLWEATASERNQINGTDYAEHMKNILVQRDPAHPTPTPIPSSTIPVTSSTPTTSGTTSTPVTVSSRTGGQSNTIPSQGATASSNETGQPTGSPTGAATHHGSGTTTIAPGITAAPGTTGPTNPNGSSSGPVTVTTVIVTSYTSICPTGFTTITTTYTTTYCPGTVPATATVTNPTPGSPAHTTAPSPPEGWTTTVTVCTQCAATPTTVTLTLPVTAPESQATAPAALPPPGWTTTVTVCTQCGPSPTTMTVTVPISAATDAVPGSGHSVGTSPEGGAGTPSHPDNTHTHHLAPPTSTRSAVLGTGMAHPRPSSSTLFVRPSPSESRVPVAPSTTPEHPAPVFTGAAARQAELRHAGGALLALALPVLIMV